MWIAFLLSFLLLIAVTLVTAQESYNLAWLKRRGGNSIAEAVPYDYVVKSGIVATADNRLLVTWDFEGPDVLNATYAHASAQIARFNNAVRRRDESWSLAFDDFRQGDRGYPVGSGAPDPTTGAMHAGRVRRYHQELRQYRHRQYLTVAYSPPKEMIAALEGMLLDKRSRISNEVGAQYEESLRIFEDGITEFQDAMRSFMRLRRLGTRFVDRNGEEVEIDDQLSFLNRCITGEDVELRSPEDGDAQRVLCAEDMTGGWWPRIGDQYVAVIAVEDTPEASTPGMLDVLQDLQMEYRRTTRIVILSPSDAAARAKGSYHRQRGESQSMYSQIAKRTGMSKEEGMVDAGRIEKAEQAREAFADVTRGLVRQVLYSHKIIFYHPDKAILDKQAKRMKSAIQTIIGFKARIEHLNAAEAWVGALPGDIDHDVSPLMMDSINAGDLSPISTVSQGLSEHPNNLFDKTKPRPPVMRVLTVGRLPYDLSPSVGQVGHTLIAAPTGAGKSTVVNAFVENHRAQYPETLVFQFDQGFSAHRYCVASGGSFTHLQAGMATGGFCPLQEIDQPGELSWAEEWIIEDVFGSVNVLLTTEQRVAVRHTLESLAGLDRAHRSLSDFQFLLRNQDATLAAALNFFTTTGSLGSLLDSRSDTLSDAKYHVFEMQTLMRLRSEAAVVPVLHYIFHRIDLRMTGATPAVIVLDESHDYMQWPTFEAKITFWLDKYRKKLGSVWLTTLNLSRFLTYSSSSTVLEACMTKIFLANPNATDARVQATFTACGCVEEDTNVIAVLEPAREIYLVQESTSGVKRRARLNMDLDAVEVFFLGASSERDIRATTAARQTSGRDCGRELLRLRANDPSLSETEHDLFVNALDDWDAEASRLHWRDRPAMDVDSPVVAGELLTPAPELQGSYD